MKEKIRRYPTFVNEIENPQFGRKCWSDYRFRQYFNNIHNNLYVLFLRTLFSMFQKFLNMHVEIRCFVYLFDL